MTTIKRNLATVLISMVASIAMAQAVSPISLGPATLTLEETQAVERVLNSKDPETLHLRNYEADLFLKLLHNGNKTVSFGIAENRLFGFNYGTDVDAYLVRENNGFAIFYESRDDDDNVAQSCSAKVCIKPPHAKLSAKEVRILKEKLATTTFASEVDSLAFNALLKHGNEDTFGLGFADDDELGAMKMRAGSYTEAYIIRSGNGVALYYEIFNGDTDELLGIRQTAPISLK